MAETNNESVGKPGVVVASMAEDFHLTNSLIGGTKAMRMAAQKYLPQEAGEENKAYNVRLKRTTLFNAFKKTVSVLAGKVFSKPLTFEGGLSEPWEGWFKNIDLEGSEVSRFSFELFKTGLTHGLVHVLVDMPVMDAKNTKTLKDDQRQNLRPYLIVIRADNLIGWRVEKINGVNTLSQIRIKEQVLVKDGDFGETLVEQIRVVEVHKTRIYTKKDSKYVLTKTIITTLDVIPLVTIYTNKKGFMRANSPLLDLAHLNVDHWQKGSDLSNILHLAQVPILFASGFPESNGKKDDLIIGANTYVQASDDQAKLAYIEPTGNGIDLGLKALERIEERMSVIGASMLINQPGGITATEKVLSEKGDNSELASMALNLQDGLNQCFELMAKWMKLTTGIPVASVNTEFGVSGNGTITPETLLKIRVAGEMSHKTFIDLLNEMTGFDINEEEDSDNLDAEGIDNEGVDDEV